jgi:osmotically inducible lipoprotein OsmB
MRNLVLVAALCLAAGACATRQQATSTAVGATAGAVVGGPVGAVVGAGAGAVAGAPGGVVDEVQGDNRRSRARRR